MDLVQFEDDTTSVFYPGYGQMIQKSWKPRIHIHLQSLTKNTIQKNPKGPTAADVDLWTKSFECFLTDQNGQMAFKAFLKSEYCEEFKRIKTKQILASTAIDMYEQFIKTDSPKQINLDFHTRDCITQSLQHPTTSCFVVAQRKVYHLMESGNYPRFIQSDFYKDLRTTACTRTKKNRRRILH
ncbi:regulator of G-protein signaling 2-like [Alosa sapidissima]|uniref:regulator of G-protein signaling 2-like n=1 Tax=Alosa sapidissima TaxID=34773 RepID=UPI001C085BA1|nr:regulator of G-protein signaling 2-like [Alosa sapidissima]